MKRHRLYDPNSDFTTLCLNGGPRYKCCASGEPFSVSIVRQWSSDVWHRDFRDSTSMLLLAQCAGRGKPIAARMLQAKEYELMLSFFNWSDLI